EAARTTGLAVAGDGNLLDAAAVLAEGGAQGVLGGGEVEIADVELASHWNHPGNRPVCCARRAWIEERGGYAAACCARTPKLETRGSRRGPAMRERATAAGFVRASLACIQRVHSARAFSVALEPGEKAGSARLASGAPHPGEG